MLRTGSHIRTEIISNHGRENQKINDIYHKKKDATSRGLFKAEGDGDKKKEGGDDKKEEDTWAVIAPRPSEDVVVELEVGSHLVSAGNIAMTEATMPEDARLAINLLQTMFQDHVARRGLDVGSRESSKRALQEFIQRPNIVRILALQAVINENLREAGYIKEPLAERVVSVLKEIGILAGAATGVAGMIVRWYKSLTPTQVASLVASAGVGILAPQAKALQAGVILAETLRQLASLYIF